MAMSSQQLPFKPCTGCIQWLLTQVSVLFSFFHVSLQAYTHNTNTHHITSFDQQTIHRWDVEARPNFTDSKLIQPNKHEMQNLLDKEVL